MSEDRSENLQKAERLLASVFADNPGLAKTYDEIGKPGSDAPVSEVSVGVVRPPEHPPEASETPKGEVWTNIRNSLLPYEEGLRKLAKEVMEGGHSAQKRGDYYTFDLETDGRIVKLNGYFAKRVPESPFGRFKRQLSGRQQPEPVYQTKRITSQDPRGFYLNCDNAGRIAGLGFGLSSANLDHSRVQSIIQRLNYRPSSPITEIDFVLDSEENMGVYGYNEYGNTRRQDVNIHGRLPNSRENFDSIVMDAVELLASFTLR